MIRVLIVDENHDAADALGEVLRQMGHHPEVAYSGGQALEKMARFSPDLFLLDLALPDMDGYELARRLRAVSGKEARVRGADRVWTGDWRQPGGESV